jgi:hypothetical protein
MFQCTPVGEYRLAAAAFGFTQQELCGIAEDGSRFAFDAHAIDL